MANMLHERPDKIATVRVVHAGSGGRSTVSTPQASHLSFGFKDLAAAIADLPSAGGTIFIESGTHLLNAQVTVPSTKNVTLIGAGKGLTTLKANASMTNMLYQTGGGSEIHLKVAGITFDGNSLATNGISANNYCEADIQDCEFKNISGIQVELKTAMNCVVRDSRFRSGANYGIRIVDEANGAFVENCQFHIASGDIGIHTGVDAGNPAKTPQISACKFYSTGTGVGRGVLMTASAGSVRDSYFFYLLVGVELDGCEQCVVENNYMFLDTTGILLTQAARCRIIGGEDDGCTTWCNVNGSGTNYFNEIWNFHNHTITNTGTQTRIWRQGTDTLGLITPEFSILNSSGVSKVRLMHDGTSGYLATCYHCSSDGNKYINMDASSTTAIWHGVSGLVLKPNAASGNGLAVRIGTTAPDDTTGGAQDGCLYVDTTNFKLYMRCGGVWKYINSDG